MNKANLEEEDKCNVKQRNKIKDIIALEVTLSFSTKVALKLRFKLANGNSICVPVVWFLGYSSSTFKLCYVCLEHSNLLVLVVNLKVV